MIVFTLCNEFSKCKTTNSFRSYGVYLKEDLINLVQCQQHAEIIAYRKQLKKLEYNCAKLNLDGFGRANEKV